MVRRILRNIRRVGERQPLSQQQVAKLSLRARQLSAEEKIRKINVERLERKKALIERPQKQRQAKLLKSRLALGQRMREFRPQPEDFSFQEIVLRDLFGHGEKIWGTQMEPVKMYNDLHPSLSNPDDETSSLFGFRRRRF